MASSLPPLSSLRGFEAAARLESISRAADELFITHGAVSHQIRAVEEAVGVPLFVKRGRGVTLTPDGRLLAATVRTALGQIADTAAELRRRAQTARLSISVMPSFGARWLMPRIARFMAEHPDWSISIDSATALADFARDDVDVAIRYGRGPWPGVEAEHLMDDEYFLVASPTLQGGGSRGGRSRRGRLPKHPSELVDYPLMRTDAKPWNVWCAAAGIALPPPTRGVDYQDMGVMLQGVVDGLGIMLVRRTIAAAELERGTLVRVFDIAIPSLSSYWIVWPKDPPPSERVLAFRDWLRREVRTTRTGGKKASRRKTSVRRR